jgi:hypothetical protein
MAGNPAHSDTAMPTRVVPDPGKTSPRNCDADVRDLLITLTALHELLKQLLELAGRKLAAMRAADADTLQQCAAEESAVLQTLFEREKQRDAALARLAQSLPGRVTARSSLSAVAERLSEPLSSRLRAKIAGLRQIATALQEKNRLAASVARNLHDHIRAVFSDVANVNQESIVYGPSGKHEQRNKQAWVDAVG